MKKLIALTLIAISAITSCSKFDDSEIWNKLNDHENRIAYLEDLCKKMNTDIVNLQTLVTALDAGDYIVNASPLVTGDGYTFIFKSGKSVVIYNGKDGSNGSNGTNGTNGKDGEDGKTPVISVKQDVDGVYYWTVNGEWLIIDGEKVKASSIDGINGQNGKDGITPHFKIEDGYWYISYDNEQNWEKLGKAIGDNGLNGEDGDAFFAGVTIGDGYVIFTLNDIDQTQIKLPFVVDAQLTITVNQAGTLNKLLSIEQQRSVTSLLIYGEINEDDIDFINIYLRSLEHLDLSGATIKYYNSSRISANPFKDICPNRTLRTLVVGNLMAYDQPCSKIDISYCLALESLTFTANNTCIADGAIDSNTKELIYSPNLKTIKVAEGVTELYLEEATSSKGIYCVSSMVELPSTLEKVGYYLFGIYNKSNVVCKAENPPTIYQYVYGSPSYYLKPIDSFYDAYSKLKNMVLYVPAESVNLYKSHSGWKAFGTILPIEEE